MLTKITEWADCLPIIKKIYNIENAMIVCEKSNEKCFGCFGKIDEKGLYI